MPRSSRGSTEAHRRGPPFCAPDTKRPLAPRYCVSCYRLPLARDSTYAWTPFTAHQALLDAAEAGLQEVTDEVRAGQPDLDVDAVPSAGPVGPELVDNVTPADVVGVGASAHSGTAAVLFGNPAHHLVRHSPCPVAVVPATAAPGAPDRVVVGIDGSSDADEALLRAGDAAERYGVELIVVHAWEYPYRPLEVPSLQARDLMRIDAACVLETALAAAHDRFGAAVHGELVEAGAAAGLIDTVQDGDFAGSRVTGKVAYHLVDRVGRVGLEPTTHGL